MQSVRIEDHYAVRSDTIVMVVGKLRGETALAVRPTLEEDMRRLTLGSARGVKTADSSRALEVGGCYSVPGTLQWGEKAPDSRRRYCN